MNYYLFEKDLTSNHVSYHFCFDTLTQKKFNPKSKIKPSYEIIKNNLKRLPSLDRRDIIKQAITPENKFIIFPYYHLMVDSNTNNYKNINNLFNIETDFKYTYFTKLIKNLDKPTKFKCGFSEKNFREITHDLKTEAFKISKLFPIDCYSYYAFDFDIGGNIINDNINVELFFPYTKESLLNATKIISSNFKNINLKTLNLYSNIFKNFNSDKFYFHYKIKLYHYKEDPTIKFYRSYNPKNIF